jgi:hypothetical protein
MFDLKEAERLAKKKFHSEGAKQPIIIAMESAGLDRTTWYRWKRGDCLPSGRAWKRLLDVVSPEP